MEENKTYVGLILDENKVIKSWCLPADSCEIKGNIYISKCHCGLTKFIDGKLINPPKSVIEQWNLRQEENNRKYEQINELKQLLKDSDFKAIKYAEGCYTDAEYETIKKQRQAWRDEINSLENDI